MFCFFFDPNEYVYRFLCVFLLFAFWCFRWIQFLASPENSVTILRKTRKRCSLSFVSINNRSRSIKYHTTVGWRQRQVVPPSSLLRPKFDP